MATRISKIICLKWRKQSNSAVAGIPGGRLLKSFWVVLSTVLLGSTFCAAQTDHYYSRLNTFSIYSEYSNTSSYIHWGVSRRRRLVSVGGSYARRFDAPHWFDWTPHASVFYELEVAPVLLIQNPIATDVYNLSSGPIVMSGPIVELCVTGSYVSYDGLPFVRTSCGRRWEYAGGASPVGFRVNFDPEKRLQPFIDSHLGFLLSSRDEPVSGSSNFNFTFEFGAGLELYRNTGRSVALEYRLHHLSNAYLSNNNPGVDSQIIKLTYSFGGKIGR